ncbi:MAG: hypothetical protein HN929_09450 [Chloroflexi bacterium]|nr:hypothetical protein [Chloroflexota bacterium]MBT7081673.1 hypothetical protein [Chloroflexota bacterium]
MFGYKCSKCDEGTVREKIILKYPTKMMGYPFVVDEAKLGICDKCKTEYFSDIETQRWERLFEESLLENKLFLLPQETIDIRKQLDLSMEQFAFLIGCTRQSLHNWGKKNRSQPQSRTADLMMKLVYKSQIEGQIDVTGFLIEEAQKLGITIILSQKAADKSDSLSQKEILEELYRLHDTTIPIRDVRNALIIRDADLRETIKQGLDRIGPTEHFHEEYCEYVCHFENGDQMLWVKQYPTGDLTIEGHAGELYKRILEVIIPAYNMKYPGTKIFIRDYIAL